MSRNVPKKRWLADEIEAVKRGEVPEGRTYLQAASYAHKHNIPWKELRQKTCKWWWRPEEDAAILAGQIVPNRSWEAIRLHKREMGLPYSASPRYSDFKEYYTSRGQEIPKGTLDEKYRRGENRVKK